MPCVELVHPPFHFVLVPTGKENDECGNVTREFRPAYDTKESRSLVVDDPGLERYIENVIFKKLR